MTISLYKYGKYFNEQISINIKFKFLLIIKVKTIKYYKI